MVHAPRRALAAVFLALCLLEGCAHSPAGPANSAGLPTVTPEEAGFSSQRLLAARAQFDRIGSAAFMALHDGRVFVSWGNVERRFSVHSMRKTLLGSLYGIAVARGQMDTSATLARLGIDDIPPSLTAAEQQARVIDLLKCRSGVYHEAAYEGAEMIALRPPRGSHAPGSFYYYNNWDFNTLGAIYEQGTGVGIFEAFKREIADPVGMQDFGVADGTYFYERQRSRYPAYPFRMTARDLARFGVLFQRNGVWEGRQVVPPSWIAASWTPTAVDNAEIGLGYGLLWGILPAESPVGIGPAFLAGGVGVQFVLIKPDDRLVLVHLVDTDRRWSTTGEQIGQLFSLVLAARDAGDRGR